ncbi:MAG: alpha/beta hydrolase [Acidimicrobiales bacterium]
MPLDPQAKVFLDQLAALGGPPMSEATPADARTQMAMLAGMASRPPTRVPTVDRTVPGPDGDIPVRIYQPPSTDPLPVVVFFHGGGWVIGDIETHDGLGHTLASGVPAVVISVDYRLAPEHPFPAAVDDCEAVTAWAAQHAGEIGGDGTRLAVAGDSAGGNLAAVVARRARDAGGPAVAFQLLVYPVTDATCSSASYRENADGYLLTADMMAWFLAHYLGPDGTDKAQLGDVSPLFIDDLQGLPPALVVTAEFDPLRDEGEAFAERLRAAGVDVTLSRYDGMIHGFWAMDAVFDSGVKALEETVAALREGLRAPTR